MDRLRRSLRDSFRKKKDHVPECSKPHQWQADEAAVRDGTCSFPVKYLGCVEVFESRGMQVCEEALKMLRNSRRRSIKGVLYVTGDGLRVVDDDTKGLIVDQTIEKVSFCAPDRNHEKGFSYICRDGTTRRWMCHGFLAVKDSGERLSHAVGCAFAACLERKQKRDKECGVTMTFDPNNSTFTRMGSFRQTTLTERMQETQESKPAVGGIPIAGPSPIEAPPVKAVHNPYAIERPHATPMMLQRQGSFRGFNQLNQTSPFKRQLSLRISDLPSNLERQQRSMSLESSEFSKPTSPVSPPLSPRAPRTRLHSLPNAVSMSPIPESSPVADKQPSDTISAMCQQLARGLNLLSNTDDPFSRPFGPTPLSAPPTLSAALPRTVDPTQASRNGVGATIRERDPWAGGASRAEVWLATSVSTVTGKDGDVVASSPSSANNAVTKSASNPLNLFASQFNNRVSSAGTIPLPPPGHPVLAPPRRAPHIAHLRSQSLGAAGQSHPHAASRTLAIDQVPPAPGQAGTGWSTVNGGNSNGLGPVPPSMTGASFRDPFDAEWAALAAARSRPSTNPFAQNSVKAFEVHM